jgi:hypothetical protein
MRLRWLAMATIFMSIPLFASYPIKHTMFPAGYGFVAMYTWGLIAVLVLPVLLLGEIGVVLIVLRRHADRISIRTHAFAAIVAILAETIFLYVRSYA